ncbi:MAG: hypothetical protein IPM29_22590 [Planctomycetes bacterium]|nr:hypothetical protein [Planctomycetota bacterium]
MATGSSGQLGLRPWISRAISDSDADRRNRRRFVRSETVARGKGGASARLARQDPHVSDSTDLDVILRRTLDDGRLSRGERSAVSAVLEDLDPKAFAHLRSRVFAIAREELARRPADAVLAWCEAVVQLAASREAERSGALAAPRTEEAWFSPDEPCLRRIVELIDRAARSIDVCVFTITDDRIAAALHAAHRRGVALRIVSDDEKAEDLGSDVHALAAAGIPVRTDRAPDHMHHKFALFDGRVLLTGSFNWTRGAGRDNEENFVVTDSPALVARFARQFDALWQRFA